MIRATTIRSNSFYVSHAVVRLELFGEDGQLINHASGFIIDERDFLSLYTCWHVVTGVDPYSLPRVRPRKRVRMNVHTLVSESRASGVTAIGGSGYFTLELYNDAGRPNWAQSLAQEGCENVELPVPHWDCVRIDVERFREKIVGAFHPDDDILNYLDISEDAFIVGYPFGYSAAGDSPYPIFLRRTRASSMQKSAFTLLDGPGAPGMSGGPVVTRINNEWRLAGIYCGVEFPEAARSVGALGPEIKESRLPLGRYLETVVARQVVGVPPILMGLHTITGS